MTAMASSPSQKLLSRNTTIALGVVALHVGALWALQSGLLRRAVEAVVPAEILVEFIEPAKPIVTPPPPAPPVKRPQLQPPQPQPRRETLPPPPLPHPPPLAARWPAWPCPPPPS